jgi:hypothetical protein
MSSTEKTATLILQNLTKQSSSSLSKVAPKTVQRAMLLSEDTFTTPLFLLVMDVYGPEALEWAPETIRLELEEDFKLKLPKATLDKIMAAVSLVTTNFFYKDVTRFIEIANILAGDDFQPDEFEPADAEEIMLAITEAMLIWPPDEDKEDTEFSPEIREYIRQVLKEEGILKPFDVLKLAFSDNREMSVNADFADDPEMFQAIYETQQSKQNDMREMLLNNMDALTKQLRLLPLRSGSTEEAISQLQEILNGVATPLPNRGN